MSYKNNIQKIVDKFIEDLNYATLALNLIRFGTTPSKTFIKHCQLCAESLSFSFKTQSDFIYKILEQIIAQKKITRKDIDLLKYILDSVVSEIDQVIKPVKIFISHSTKNSAIVDEFVELLVKIGVGQENLFCSSSVGFGIPQGSGDIFDHLKNEFQNNNLYVIFMLSDEYYNSPPCLNEMGAAWVIKSDYQAILLPNFDYSRIEGTLNPRAMSFKLDDLKNRKHSLNEMKDNILKKLELPQVNSNTWERYRDKLLDFIDSCEL